MFFVLNNFSWLQRKSSSKKVLNNSEITMRRYVEASITEPLQKCQFPFNFTFSEKQHCYKDIVNQLQPQALPDSFLLFS